MSIDAWIAIGTTLVFFKLVTAIGHSHLWFVRNERFKQKNMERYMRKVAVVPTLSWLFVVIFVCMFSLSALNIVNTENGLSGLCYGIGWLIYGINSNIFLLKFVRLGARILPTRARAVTNVHHERLSTLDFRGRVSLGLQCVALFGQTVVLCIIGPSVPGERIVMQVAAGFHMMFTSLHGLSMFFHLERIKEA